jgi:hypothetical protein
VVLRMPRPTRIGTKFYHRQRVPKDLVPLVGTKWVKESLDTDDHNVAIDRFMECAAKYRDWWKHVRENPEMTDKEKSGLTGEVYREFYNRWRDSDRGFCAKSLPTLTPLGSLGRPLIFIGNCHV